MGHTKPQILGPTEWWQVETTDGTCWVLCEDVGRENIKATDLLDHLPSHVHDTQDIMRWEFFSGYGARLTAPDCTDWTVFDTEREAKDHLAYDHDLCPMCLGDLDEQETCGKCVADLSHEDFESALHTVLEGVTVNEILHSVPGIYEIISEEYNNEALNQAYEEMRLRYEAEDTTTEGEEKTDPKGGQGEGKTAPSSP